MNQLELIVEGNRLSVNDSVYSTGGCVNYDKCLFTFDGEWNGYEKTAVFGVGRDVFRVPLDEDNGCFIPSPCTEKEGLITIGVFGTSEDSVIATNAVSHHIEEGVDGLGEWFEEDYSLVLNAVKNMEHKVAKCINDLNDNFTAVMKVIRRNGNVTESKITSDVSDGWYVPRPFEGAEELQDIALSESIDDFLDYKLNGLARDFPNYVRREQIGTDSSGEIPVYSYIFQPMNYEKTMLITGCVHGCEDMVLFAMSSFFDELCRRSEEDRTLSYLKSRVKFIVIPAVNPYSLITAETYNENDVDIGCNFPYKWQECTKRRKGDSAGDQAETANIIEYVEMIHADRLCAAVDLHVSRTTVSGKSILYPRFKDNCISALSDFIGKFNSEADSGAESKGVLAPSINPTLTNYLADAYGLNACEVVWPEELYGGMYSNENYDKLIEFMGNLIYTMAKNSSPTGKLTAEPFVKYLSWRGNGSAFDIPVSSIPVMMGISNYILEPKAPMILSLSGYVVLNVKSACTVKVNPVMYQKNSPEQGILARMDAAYFSNELELAPGKHVIPVSSVLQAYYNSYNATIRTSYCEQVHIGLAFSASLTSAAEVTDYSLMLSGTPSDLGRAVEIIKPMGEVGDYESEDIPTQYIIYPHENYVNEDLSFDD